MELIVVMATIAYGVLGWGIKTAISRVTTLEATQQVLKTQYQVDIARWQNQEKLNAKTDSMEKDNAVTQEKLSNLTSLFAKMNEKLDVLIDRT